MFTNNFDPVAFHIFSLEIRWYSLAYIIGILIGWLLCKKIFIKDPKINEKFDDMDYLHDIGDIKIKMSGCMNACGHHHVGHIGILGVDKKGEEFYQLTLGGSSENDASLGDRLGPAIAKTEVANVIGKLLDVYVRLREENERFLDTYRRVGIDPFKENVYASN